MFEFIHHVIAHPLIGLTFGSEWSIRFHAWTARRAWPEESNPPEVV